MSPLPWYPDGEAPALILFGYLLPGLNLAWETAHVPLVLRYSFMPPERLVIGRDGEGEAR